MQVEEILGGIYNNADDAVIVFELSGGIVWKNRAAELLLSKAEVSAQEVFAAIKMSGKDCGNLFVSGGGSFRKAEILGNELYIAEVYSLSRLSGAFGTPFFEKYVECIGTQTRQAVTGISASCEFISASLDSDDKSDAAVCLDNIISSCCRLLRNVDISTQLAKAVREKDLRKELIHLTDFMKNLSAGCVSAMGNDHCGICSDMPDCFVRTDRTLLMYFILMLARRIMPHKSMRLSFGASSDGQTAEITVRSEEVGDVPDSEKISNVDSAFNEAYDIIAQKLGIEYTLAPNKAVVKLKCAQHSGEVVFESDRISFGDSLFSPCRVMLSDLTEFRSFY